MRNIRKIFESAEREIKDKSCLNDNGRLSPFLNPPYDSLRPGVDSKMAYEFHEIYPEVFKEKTSFMGGMKGVHSVVGVESWKQPNELIYLHEGHFDSDRSFRSPMAVYKLEHPCFSSRYILFQQGNYQIFGKSAGDDLESGEILIHRGIGEGRFFVEPKIEDEKWEIYQEYLAWSFLSPTISMRYNNVSRAQTDHVKSSFLPKEYQGLFFNRMEQHFSIHEHIASGKFGPNYAAYRTSLDNIRMLSRWTGEGEVFLLNPERAQRIK